MGFRFQKRMRLFPGIQLNFSKSGISVTLGKPGLSVNLGKDGATGNVGIPGTGLSYRKKMGGDLKSLQEHLSNQPNQSDPADRSSAGIWKWLFFAAVVLMVVLLVARG